MCEGEERSDELSISDWQYAVASLIPHLDKDVRCRRLLSEGLEHFPDIFKYSHVYFCIRFACEGRLETRFSFDEGGGGRMEGRGAREESQGG